MSSKRLFFCIISFLLFPMWASPGFCAEQLTVKIGVINMQKVVRQSHEGKKAMEKLNKKFETLQKQLQKKQSELKAFKEDLEKKAPLMREEARAEKERQYKKMLREYKDQSDDAQYEMRQMEQKVMETILKKLEKVVRKIAKDKGYTIILEKNMPGLYYVSPDADITQEIISAYDKSVSQEGK